MITDALDLSVYWRDVLADLAASPPVAKVEPVPLRTSETATMYEVRLTSVGDYRIFAYLSVPNSAPPFPTVFYLPGYLSVVTPFPSGESNALREKYVTFTLAARGQRNADVPFTAQFPGLLTDGIDDSTLYKFRYIVADCVRGVEYLATRPEVDRARIAAVGGDYALMTAALTDTITHLVCTPQLFFDTVKIASLTNAYPLEEVNDYLRAYPEKAAAVMKTLSYFDLRSFAPLVKATTLLFGGMAGETLDRVTLLPLMSSLRGDVTFHETSHSDYRDKKQIRDWLANQLA